MKILFLAPQPFYQERGTPIAVRLASEVIAKRQNVSVTLMTYQEGIDVAIPNVTHLRVHSIPPLTKIQPGFSLKKLYTDIFFFIAAIRELWRNRKDQYDTIHAVEESVFMALLVKWVLGIPYIYDMDSSLALQITEKMPWCKFLEPLFLKLEKLAIRNSVAVVPVCDALAALAKSGGSKRTQILPDISLLDYEHPELPEGTYSSGNGSANSVYESPSLRKEAGLADDAEIILYVGNLEKYQGIDLLIEGFHHIYDRYPRAHLLIIGGIETHITAYRQKIHSLGIPPERAQLLGPRPVALLSDYLRQATILTSPRTLGNNTPMKVYSYLHSGIPLLATKLPTHTQVLTDTVAQLAEPNPKAFGKALSELLESESRREELQENAMRLAEAEYTFEVFERKLNQLYDGVHSDITGEPATSLHSRS